MTVFRNLRLRNGAKEDHVLVLLGYGFSRDSKCYYSEVTFRVYDRYLASSSFFVVNRSSISNYVFFTQYSLLFSEVAHLRQQCHDSKCVIFQERLLKVLKCCNFL